MAKKTDNERNIHECYNRTTFLKIKPAFAISKIAFSFVEFNDNETAEKRLKKSIDCYMTISEAGLLAKKITSGRTYGAIENERKKGAKYPEPVWKSPLGGVKEAQVKSMGLRTDGKAISRRFTIAPGSKKYAVLTATQCAGYTNEDGLIVPITDDPNKDIIRVALESWDEVEKIGIMLEAAVVAYMCQQTQKSYSASDTFIPTATTTEAAAEPESKTTTNSSVSESDFAPPPIIWPEDMLS